MAQIKGVAKERADLATRLAYWLCRRFSKVVEPLTLVAHHSRIAQGYGAFEFASGKSRRVGGLLGRRSLRAARAPQDFRHPPEATGLRLSSLRLQHTVDRVGEMR